jgi:hypothetical protein
MVSGSLARPKIFDMALHTKNGNAKSMRTKDGFLSHGSEQRKTIETQAFLVKNAELYDMRVLPSILVVTHNQQCTMHNATKDLSA